MAKLSCWAESALPSTPGKSRQAASSSASAGISPPDDDLIETTELPAWQRVQDVNLKSVYLCCRAALRHMAPAGRGSIINTASFVAVMGSATSQISYTASKGGVLAMSRELGVQYARQGIPPAVVDEVWDMVRTFRGYSFCKPHSASYAQVSFESAWLKTHHPAVFFASVITNQGGYYPAIAYLGDARRHRLVVRGPDANRSGCCQRRSGP